jgi:hypothetical protein
MWSSENPHTTAGAGRVQLLRRFRAASHIDYDNMKTRKGSNVLVWAFDSSGTRVPKQLSFGELSSLGRGERNELFEV